MATKPKTNTAPLQDESVGLLDDVYNFEQLSPALSQIYSEMGVEATGQFFMQVMQVMQDGKEAQVWRGPPDDYDLAAIGKRFGSGDYRVKLYGPKESGVGVGIRANRILSIRLEAGEDARLDALRNAKPNDLTLPPQSSQPAMSPESLAMAIAAAIKAAMPAPVDSLGQLKQMAEVVRSMMPASPAAQGNSFGETLAAAKSLLDISKGMNGAAIGEDGKVDVAGNAMLKGMDIFEKILSGAIAAKTGQAPAVAALSAPPADGATQPTAVSDAPIVEEDEEAAMMIKLQLKAANRAAKANVDAAEFAEQMYSIIPDDVLTTMAVTPEWFSILCATVPECSQYESWYSTARAKLLDLALEDSILIRGADGVLTVAPEEDSVSGDGSPSKSDAPAAA